MWHYEASEKGWEQRLRRLQAKTWLCRTSKTHTERNEEQENVSDNIISVALQIDQALIKKITMYWFCKSNICIGDCTE